MAELDNFLQEQLALRVEKGISNQMDEIILKLKDLSENFAIANKDEKSPFRNVLAVAVDASSSIEIIKNYIRYQVGRSGSSPIWKTQKGKDIFAKALVNVLDELDKDAQLIVTKLRKSVPKSHNLEPYLNDINNQTQLRKNIHLKLVQLFLGYLAREHTASVGEMKLKK
ncbi:MULTISPECIES: hypothetical protein [unclassified Tolypothrix]|uniref:hypothetical protein n=1 Tax=unclassified Tolypothrix TaxID=2649714 RepID=UPI0005EAAC92|nr:MULTISPECIES: hypothetical protein [unclassified Tolypothrix]BAY92691.1 hypothetical protein NIES3275_47280 [Microchaete diplosiphon NIES-3275]EKF05797.1 hypothetical protein FDUTEX481_00654 [Tolypothrix sp. PCC 7601]MBE9081458.1 hypothetical protein [Tolypothrix sp. LEGE 11397]UYD26630.1 hypothetical protein HGR01_00395 [Tolypothrix sp. PCC 7712]UYD37513.1 hypothetical protein HG267_18420 [Tolypothrix sp. PCC 7601]